MPSVEEYLEDPLYANWVKSSLALNITNEVIRPFAVKEIKRLHQTIISPLAYKGPCTSCTVATAAGCRRGICSHIKREIEDHHCFQKHCFKKDGSQTPSSQTPSFKNTDIKSWRTDPWEIAKCYMPKGKGYGESSATDADFSASINVIMNCRHFQQFVGCNPKDPRGKYCKARTFRNTVMHSMRVFENEMTANLDILIDIIEEIATTFSKDDLDDAVTNIKKIKDNTVTITMEDISKAEKQAKDARELTEACIEELHEAFRKEIQEAEHAIQREIEKVSPSLLDEIKKILEDLFRKLSEIKQRTTNTVQEIFTSSFEGQTPQDFKGLEKLKKMTSRVNLELHGCDNATKQAIQNDITKLDKNDSIGLASGGVDKLETEMKVENTVIYKGSIILEVTCSSIKGLIDFWDGCMDGRVAKALEKVRDIYREHFKCNTLEFDVILPKKEVSRCMHNIVEDLPSQLRGERLLQEIEDTLKTLTARPEPKETHEDETRDDEIQKETHEETDEEETDEEETNEEETDEQDTHAGEIHEEDTKEEDSLLVRIDARIKAIQDETRGYATLIEGSHDEETHEEETKEDTEEEATFVVRSDAGIRAIQAMPSVEEYLGDPLYANWVKSSLALNITNDVMRPFAVKEIKKLHQTILSALPDGASCTSCIVDTADDCPHGICSHIKREIVNQHWFSNPSFVNTSISSWCTDPWEIAKCYMPKGEDYKISSAADADFSASINVIMNCRHFQSFGTYNPYLTEDKYFKIKDNKLILTMDHVLKETKQAMEKQGKRTIDEQGILDFQIEKEQEPEETHEDETCHDEIHDEETHEEEVLEEETHEEKTHEETHEDDTHEDETHEEDTKEEDRSDAGIKAIQGPSAPSPKTKVEGEFGEIEADRLVNFLRQILEDLEGGDVATMKSYLDDIIRHSKENDEKMFYEFLRGVSFKSGTSPNLIRQVTRGFNMIQRQPEFGDLVATKLEVIEKEQLEQSAIKPSTSATPISKQPAGLSAVLIEEDIEVSEMDASRSRPIKPRSEMFGKYHEKDVMKMSTGMMDTSFDLKHPDIFVTGPKSPTPKTSYESDIVKLKFDESGKSELEKKQKADDAMTDTSVH